MNDPARMVEACRAADAAEAAAYADMYAGAPAGVRTQLGLQVREISGATLLLAPGLPVPIFNRVIGLGTFEPATQSALDRILATYADAGVTSHWISVSPAAQPVELTGWLGARGLAPPKRATWAQMGWPDRAPPEVRTSLHVETAGAADAVPFAQVVAQAFGMPPVIVDWLAHLVGRPGWQTYVARKDGRIVGGGFVFVQPPLAWLGLGSVLPEFRGDHGQLALFAARIAHARSLGCTSIHTETGEPMGDEPNPSLTNMVRCGFEKIASRVNYAK